MTTDTDHTTDREQFKELWQWSRFYHEAEIKVNTGALAISSIATLSEKFLTPTKATNIRVLCWDMNIVGVVVILASAAALVSTLGYWRYYEFCDLYAKQFRNEYLSEEKREAIRKSLNEKFDRASPILSKVPVNAHHMIWIVTQLLFFCVGLRLLAATSVCP
jgi:hypothetical protein